MATVYDLTGKRIFEVSSSQIKNSPHWVKIFLQGISMYTIPDLKKFHTKILKNRKVIKKKVICLGFFKHPLLKILGFVVESSIFYDFLTLIKAIFSRSNLLIRYNKRNHLKGQYHNSVQQCSLIYLSRIPAW